MHIGTFAGFIGKDAELKSLPSGDSVCNFSIGVSTGTKDKPGTLWVSCALFGKRADSLHSYLRKGSPVTVSGDIDLRTWISQQSGQAGGSIECRVDKLTFGGKSSNNDNGSYQEAPAVAPAPQQSPAAAASTQAVDFDEEIPF